IALSSTLPTGSLADCGANFSVACAWSAGMPRMRSTTRRAFRGVTRTNRALALASISVSLPSSSGELPAATPVVADVAAEGPGGRELAELVPDHRLGNEHRHVLAAVVHGDRVAEHRRDDHRAARPRLDDVLGALVVLHVHLLHQVVVDERALLQATRHCRVLLPLLLAAPAGDQLVAGLVRRAGAALGLAPRTDRVPATGGLALAAAHRVVDRVHGHTAHGGPAALPATPAGLAELDVALLGIADLTDGCPAARVHHPDFAGRHAQGGAVTFAGQELDT